MKTYILACFMVLSGFQISLSQYGYKGIALKKINGYGAGDTVDIYGFKKAAPAMYHI